MATLPQSLHDLPFDVTNCGALLLTLAALTFLAWPARSPFLRVGKSWPYSLLSGRSASTFTMEKQMQEGYTKVIKKSQQPFVMKFWALDYVFLPAKYLVDIKRADAQALNFLENISDAFGLYASVDNLYSSDLMVDVVRRGINTQLPNIVTLINEECDYAFSEEIGSSTAWVTFKAATLLGNIMHRTTSRILIGPELCRSKAFLRTSMNFADSIFINGLVLSMLPLGPFRRVMSRLLSVFHRRNLRKAMRIVLPLVEARFQEFEIKLVKPPGPGGTRGERQKYVDAIEWSLELSKDLHVEDYNPRKIALSLLHNLWAGSAAPAGLVTQMVYQVLLEPPSKYLAPLRVEAERVIALHGRTDKALSSMTLMDSFIREINRLYPTGSATCARTVTDPRGFTFHDGLKLPSGTRIAFPGLAIQTDPANFTDPLAFDGFRFARLKEGSFEDTGDWKGGAATVAETNLAFGFGTHSCPGRYYAIRKVKLIFSKLILEYDLQWAGDAPKAMPSRLSVNGQFAPNQTTKISVKRRTTLP